MENNIKLSFDVLAKSKSFNKINEEGMRPWLRQHIDDMFLSAIKTGLLEKSFDWILHDHVCPFLSAKF